MRSALGALLALLSLGGCGHRSREAITLQRMDKVVAQVKREVGYYISQYNRHIPERRATVSAPQAQGEGCGNGTLDFRLTSVVLSLTTTNVSTGSFDGGATIPTGTPLTVDLNASGSNATTNSQKLQFGSSILRNPDYVFVPSKDDPSTFELANTLGALRQSLLRASAAGPCFDASRNDADPANTFTIGFTVKKDLKAGGGIGFEVVKLGGSYERSVETENTVTVTFRPDGVEAAPSNHPRGRRRSPTAWILDAPASRPAAPARPPRPENPHCPNCWQLDPGDTAPTRDLDQALKLLDRH